MPGIAQTQMIWGIVVFDETTNAPTSSVGSGNFTIDEGGTGLYDVLFDDTVSFSTTPTVVVTQIYNSNQFNDYDPTGDYGGGDTTDNAVVVAVDPTKFRVVTGDSTGKRQKRMFSFLVVGPGTQSVADPNKQVIYGNVVYDNDTGTGNELERASGGGGVTLYQRESNNTWGYKRSYGSADNSVPSSSEQNLGYHPPEGEYGIEPTWDVSDFAIVVQQIFSGDVNSSNIGDFESSGGNTRDNAVADSISENPKELSIFTAGDNNGNRSARNIGFIAVGE